MCEYCRVHTEKAIHNLPQTLQVNYQNQLHPIGSEIKEIPNGEI